MRRRAFIAGGLSAQMLAIAAAEAATAAAPIAVLPTPLKTAEALDLGEAAVSRLLGEIVESAARDDFGRFTETHLRVWRNDNGTAAPLRRIRRRTKGRP
jgi:hypothetical protein